MPFTPHADRPLAASPGLEASAILARARALKQAAGSGTAVRPLLGKNLALMCASEGPEAELFRQAGGALGARVATVRATLSDTSTHVDILRTAHLLGRLYDGVECQGMAHGLVAQVSAAASVPVFDAVASSAHPSARLAAELDDADPRANRYFVVQAVLVESLA